MARRAVAIAAAAGAAAQFVVRHRLNFAAWAGIASMTIAAGMLLGLGFAFATFGIFTWSTTIIAVELTARKTKEPT